MSGDNLYEQVLRQVERGAKVTPPRPPRSSASVVLWRRSGEGLEVFWIKRAAGVPFMAGFHAFPGGGVSKADSEVRLVGPPLGIGASSPAAALPEAVTDGVDELGPILCPGLPVCALRELFEETGVLLAPSLGVADVFDRLAVRLSKARPALESRQIGFAELLENLHLEADASRLVYAGRWLTPPLGPLRFDNRFFLLEWPAFEPQQPVVVPGEAESGEWVRPVEALSRWESGEITTAPPILHVLRVLHEDGPEAGLARLREPWEANLGPHRQIEFRPGVLLFPLRTPTLPPASFTNCYLFGLDDAVLVDPGSPSEMEIDRLATALRVLQSSGRRNITAIWLTHHHPDHVGGVEALRQRFGIPVAAHPLTAERLAGSGIPIDLELTDGQRVLLGGRSEFPVRVIHTPGHARGHLCFFDETFGSLLAGDLTAGFGTIVIDPPEGNMGQYLSSLRKIKDVAPRALFPAHGPTSLDVVTKMEEYLAHRLWREGRILESWRSGIREPSKLRESVYEDIPTVVHPLAERQIVAHLENLGAAGKLED